MTHESITPEQVAAQIADAERRAADALRAELRAQTAEEFNEASRQLHKAADDRHHWNVIRNSLDRLHLGGVPA